MKKSIILGIIMTVLTIVAVSCLNVIFTFNDTDYTVTITDKDRIVDDDGGKYIVFAETDMGETIVFENTDTIIRGKINSSDIQGQLKIGKTYTVTVIGYRMPLFSAYQNIIKVREVD